MKDKYINNNHIIDDLKSFRLIDKNNIELKNKYLDYVDNGILYGDFEQINRYGLQMFHTYNFKNIYYSKELDIFLVMNLKNEKLIIKSIISKKYIPFSEIILRIDIPYNKLELGFTPREKDKILFNNRIYDGENEYRLLYLGDLSYIETDKLFFPLLSHA